VESLQGDFLRNGGYPETVSRRSMAQAYLQPLFYYHSRNDKETDFVLREGNRITRLVQACYDMSKAKTEKREVDSLVKCAGELGCASLTIVTWNEERTIQKDGYTVNVVPMGKFSSCKT
jgi:uncharacterized protein